METLDRKERGLMTFWIWIRQKRTLRPLTQRERERESGRGRERDRKREKERQSEREREQ